MKLIFKKWLQRLGSALALILLTVFCVRAWDAWRSPPLKLWHTEAPHELKARQIDAADWEAWIKAENAVFDEVRTRVTEKLPPEDQLPSNRYFAGSPLNPEHFAVNWNRSFVMMPDGPPRGAVVLLHGLTDSPYSLRHIADLYRRRGFVAVGIRLPGHGTVPAGLTRVRDGDWMAATRLAVRTARKLVGEGAALHIVGYSNGGALAVRYTLDALDDAALPKPDRVVLISPMIGITSFARFAGVLGWPSMFPSFAKAAWLDVIPEYNPFKYNSFPVNGARQSSQMARAVRDALEARAGSGALDKLPPILTFQSVLDSTVLSSAVVDTLYAKVPANHSELVLFDRNHATEMRALIRPRNADLPHTLLPPPPRKYDVTVVSNQGSQVVEARRVAAGDSATSAVALSARYPEDTFSLSHVALPFPPDDALYGSAPTDEESFGIHLGTVAARGERGALIVSTDTLMRASSNPFFDYLLGRIDGDIPGAPTTSSPP
ncbi:MAG TPA: alpha/beta hydrolase [Steroidobacteraceae bacterium]|nr:alpha/beta hydrolase [Steroidobacteraceae bacterium]